jgi:hypothetical protein
LINGQLRSLKSAIVLLLGLLTLIAGISLLGPSVIGLGEGVRVVYLHGAWVWTALLGLLVAAGLGLAGLVFNNQIRHSWSQAFGLAGLAFWVSYLPLSLWAMQLNWNGLFLEEPRWRLALDFAIAGVLLQLALLILQNRPLTSLVNFLFFMTLVGRLFLTEEVMHPNSPIMNSDSAFIQIFFLSLTALCVLALWQLSRIFKRVTYEHEGI